MTGIIGIVAPILKLVVEALFRSRYPDMALPSSFVAFLLCVVSIFVSVIQAPSLA